MNTTEIIALIDAEIAQLEQVRAALTATGKKLPGRPRSTAAPIIPAPKRKKKRNLSPEGRARIAAAMKAHWAAQRKAAD